MMQAHLATSKEPASDLESRIVAIWADVLCQPVGAQDDFYGLGGDSMLMMMILFRIKEELGVELGPHWLDEHPTPALCAQCVARALAADELAGNASREGSVEEGEI